MTPPGAPVEHASRFCECEFHRARRAYLREYMPEYRRGLRRRTPPAPQRERLRLPHWRTRDAIEKAIARGWTTSQIMHDLSASYEHVRAVRIFLDRINETAA